MTKILLQYIIGFFLAFFIYPTATKEYYGIFNGFYLGIMHGSNLFNLIFVSLFTEGHLVKAVIYGEAYRAGWFIGIILFTCGVVFTVIKFFQTVTESEL